MSFNIKLQTNNSEHICVDKDLYDITTLSGTLRDGSSIIDPIILVEADLNSLTTCNYLTIESFNRSYFVQDIKSVSTGLVEIYCHVDVLSSFANEIRANKGIIRRAESEDAYNLYINDDSLVAYQDPYILTEPFPNGFTGATFILAVAGA